MERTFKIIYTSDTHGHIFPVNYAAGCGESSGLLNLADVFFFLSVTGLFLFLTVRTLNRRRLA